MQNSGEPDWLLVNGEVAGIVAETAAADVAKRIAAGLYASHDPVNISQRKIAGLSWELTCDNASLENVRALARDWEVAVTPPIITSHRPFLGPIIVAFKKIVYPFVEAVLRPTLKTQREWNGHVVEARLLELRRREE